MVQVKHISFKDWNPIGKPHKIPQGNSGDSPSSVKARETLINSCISL